jgi:hypothetical protein
MAYRLHSLIMVVLLLQWRDAKETKSRGSDLDRQQARNDKGGSKGLHGARRSVEENKNESIPSRLFLSGV